MTDHGKPNWRRSCYAQALSCAEPPSPALVHDTEHCLRNVLALLS
jgi:hypothetical protein